MDSIRRFNGDAFTMEMSTPILRPTEEYWQGRRVYELVERFHLRIDLCGGSFILDVPAGFKTDFASFPRVLQLLLGNRDNYLEESIIHDYLYRQEVPVFFSNSMMRVVSERLRRSMWKRWVIFYGLSLFGWKSPFVGSLISLFKHRGERG